MGYRDVLASAPLLSLITAYQAGVNLDVCVLTRLGHNPANGDLGPVHAVMAPWLDRVGLRFIHELCPSLVFSYALEYGRVDLLRELMATKMMFFTVDSWHLVFGKWTRCIGQHRHLQRSYADAWDVCYEYDRIRGPISLDHRKLCVVGHLWHLAVAACLGGHVDLLRRALKHDVIPYPSTLLAIALRAGRACIAQEFLARSVIFVFTADDVRHAVTSGSVDLVVFLLENSAGSMVAEAFREGVIQNQLVLLQRLCTTCHDQTYWLMALQIAAANLRDDVIAHFAAAPEFHLTPAEAARVQRRRKRIAKDLPVRDTRLRK
ncbi:hypothetical protein SDRG_03993 [Saprolegnia diclina VS20]|uniref:Uncharacterized protein n=1 Tax=Saprolegnia diclina (strain VS20) TaxID=1156394 RepID=T0QWK2_SAPDV|nr:hypothetical protein SDRG_03993 [Saprolegnia diclina VS20]EQC39041.1 hypothetical protein SDRG_03993 [Saprolegnia diclina VS20]|eukprot:XP_008607865.1 hypothetical protein SDRG_03993 [Saprolegnia diclina VS20]